MKGSILFNFRIPSYLKAEFEKSCTRRNVSMTSQLNVLIHNFLIEDMRQKEEIPSEDYEPISIASTNYFYDDFPCIQD
jgi:hypothetical protein